MYSDYETGDVICPQCDCEFYAPDHEVPVVYLTREEIAANRKETRDKKAFEIRNNKRNFRELYISDRRQWWGGRHFRRITKATIKIAEKTLLDHAKPILTLSRLELPKNTGDTVTFRRPLPYGE